MDSAHTVMVLQKELKNLNMLLPRLTNCLHCSNIMVLLADIDRKLDELSNSLYNNVVFSLNNSIPGIVMEDLLNYKRILTYKLCNKDYAPSFSVERIASQIKLLKFK